jgi:hypothetical protein
MTSRSGTVPCRLYKKPENQRETVPFWRRRTVCSLELRHHTNADAFEAAHRY